MPPAGVAAEVRWVTPEFAMQQLVYSKTNVSGPGHIAIVLPSLPEIKGYSRNVVTLAFPTIVGDGRKVPGFSPKITAKNAPGFDGARLLDNAPATFVTLPPPTPKKPQVLDLEFAQPFEAERLVLSGRDRAQEFDGILQTSDDGNSFRTIRNFRSTSTNLTVTFEQTPARHFRIAITTSQGKALEFFSLELFPIHRIELYKAKSGLSRGPWPLRERLSLPDYSAVHLKDVLDLSTNTDESGRLNCDLPKGDWTILRFGTTLMGTENHPAPAGGLGLECDKLSAEAIEGTSPRLLGNSQRKLEKMCPVLSAQFILIAGKLVFKTGLRSFCRNLNDCAAMTQSLTCPR